MSNIILSILGGAFLILYLLRRRNRLSQED
jgi:hypothetical protein